MLLGFQYKWEWLILFGHAESWGYTSSSVILATQTRCRAEYKWWRPESNSHEFAFYRHFTESKKTKEKNMVKSFAPFSVKEMSLKKIRWMPSFIVLRDGWMVRCGMRIWVGPRRVCISVYSVLLVLQFLFEFRYLLCQSFVFLTTSTIRIYFINDYLL